jgi:uncharacterized protein (TIGR02466 family)
MKFEINTIFPTTFITSHIEREITKDEIEFVTRHGLPDMVTTNNGNTTSNETYILNDKTLSSVLEFIQAGIKHYIDTVIVPREGVEFYITQSWLNYTKPGQYHHKHRHPNSIISGVFYFNAEENKDRINFFNHTYERIEIVKKEFNIFNASSWWFPVKTGQLVIFNSELEHMVETTTSSDTRISLAFNVFAKGYLGDTVSLTALHL